MSPDNTSLPENHDEHEAQISCHLEQGLNRLKKLWDDEDRAFSSEIKVFVTGLNDIKNNSNFGGIAKQYIAKTRDFLLEIVSFSQAVVAAAVTEECNMRRVARDIEEILGQDTPVSESLNYKLITYGGTDIPSNILYTGAIHNRIQGSDTTKTPPSIPESPHRGKMN